MSVSNKSAVICSNRAAKLTFLVPPGPRNRARWTTAQYRYRQTGTSLVRVVRRNAHCAGISRSRSTAHACCRSSPASRRRRSSATHRRETPCSRNAETSGSTGKTAFASSTTPPKRSASCAACRQGRLRAGRCRAVSPHPARTRSGRQAPPPAARFHGGGRKRSAPGTTAHLLLMDPDHVPLALVQQFQIPLPVGLGLLPTIKVGHFRRTGAQHPRDLALADSLVFTCIKCILGHEPLSCPSSLDGVRGGYPT